MHTPALLALADGTVFTGHALGATGVTCSGEVVFNTAMTGYQEILTDPSYARQLVTLTYPHIGNYGTTDEDEESPAIHAAGLIIRDLPPHWSNFRGRMGLDDYLKAHATPGICGFDTRKLTRILRTGGAQNGCLTTDPRVSADEAVAKARACPSMSGQDLAREVTTAHSYRWRESNWQLGNGFAPAPESRYRVIAYDFGIKRNILRLLCARGCDVTVVPATTDAQTVLAQHPDGVFLSNGPGDPEPCTYAREAIAALLEARIPLFGICLGHQLLSLASGARTLKMKFGHHGANHPVRELATGRVLITSQNHGFAVDEASLPPCLKVTHVSLFDGSVQGVERTDRPAFGFQGHPEASPGPQDARPLFDHFIELMRAATGR